MGGDGGSIPRRDEIVKVKRRQARTESKLVLQAYRHAQCALSNQLLRPPLVICDLGFLYNKQAVVEHLLRRKTGNGTVPKSFAHLRSLGDVYTVNAQYETDEKTRAKLRGSLEQVFMIGAVTGSKANGSARFVVMRACGCVVADSCFKQKGLSETADSQCLACGKPTDEEFHFIVKTAWDEANSVLPKGWEEKASTELTSEEKHTRSTCLALRKWIRSYIPIASTEPEETRALQEYAHLRRRYRKKWKKHKKLQKTSSRKGSKDHKVRQKDRESRRARSPTHKERDRSRSRSRERRTVPRSSEHKSTGNSYATMRGRVNHDRLKAMHEQDEEKDKVYASIFMSKEDLKKKLPPTATSTKGMAHLAF